MWVRMTLPLMLRKQLNFLTSTSIGFTVWLNPCQYGVVKNKYTYCHAKEICCLIFEAFLCLMKFRFLCVSLLFLITSQSFSQSNEFWFAFKLSAVEKNGENKFLITIDKGSELGLTNRTPGEVWVTKQHERKEESHFVKNIELQGVSESTASALVESEEVLYEGDILFVEIPVKAGVHTSFFYLISYAISIADESGNPYYTFEEIMKHDGYPLRTEKFKQMQAAINTAGRKLEAIGDKEKVQEGKNKGKFVYEVLSNADTLTVWSYLYHITMDYNQTMGKSIPLIKGFYEYTLGGDETTSTELKNMFVGAKLDEAEVYFIQYKRRINEDLVNSWAKEAKEMRIEKKYSEAAELLEACMFLGDKLDKPYNVALYAYEMALIFDGQSQHSKSIPWFNKSAEKFKQADNDYGEGVALYYGGVAYEYNNQQPAALDNYKRALAVREKLLKEYPNEESYSTDLYNSLSVLGRLFKSIENYDTAKEFYLRALNVARSIGDKENEATSYWDLGNLAEQSNSYQSGIENFEKSYQIYSTLSDSSSMIELRRNQAISYAKLKMVSNSKQSIAKAIALARSWNKPDKLAYVLNYQGLLGYENKDYELSLQSYLESEKINRSLGDTTELISAKKNISKAYRDSKKIKPAIAQSEEIILMVKANDLDGKASALWDLAYLYGKDYANQLKKGIGYYTEASKLYAKLNDTTNLITVSNNIAFQYRDLKDSVNAYKFHNYALSLTTAKARLTERADTYDRIGITADHFKNYQSGLSAHLEALHLFKESKEWKKAGKAAEDVATAYKGFDDFVKVAQYYKESIQLYRQASEKLEEAESYWDYAYNMGQQLLNYDTAIKNYRIAYGLYMQEGDSVHASVMLSNIGQTYWSKLDFESAIKSHREAIELAKKCNNQEQVASSWSKLATLYTESNNPIAAAEALNNSVIALVTLNDSTLLSAGYNDLADSYLKSKDYLKALDYYSLAITIRKAQKDSSNWALSVYALAGAYQNKTEYAKAIQAYDEALKIQRKLKDKLNAAYSLSNLGLLAQMADNDYKKANIYLSEAIKLATELKDDYLLGYCYLRMKGLTRAQGNFKLSEDYINKTLVLYKKEKRPKDVAYVLAEMGNDASYVYGDNVKALQLIDQAQVISDTLTDIQLKAYLLGVRSTIVAEAGEFNKALSLGQESLELYKSVDSEWGLAGEYIDIGNVYKQLSEYDLSLKFQQKSDSLYKKMNSEYNRLAPLANIGAVYTAQGNYKKGLEYYELSLAIMKKAGDFNENVGIIQASIGESYYYLSDYAQSDKWIRESLNTFNKVGAVRPKMESLNVMGRLKIDEDKFDEAAKFLTEAINKSKEKSLKVSYVSGLGLLGQLEVRRKNYLKAKPLLEECIKASRDMGKYNTLWESLYWLGVLYKESKQLPQSRDYLKESVVVIEKIRNKVSGGDEARKLFSSDKNILRVYEALIDVLLQLGETDLAMSYLQKNNEDNLKEKFKSLDVKFENSDKNKVLEQERSMKAKLDGIEQQIANEKTSSSTNQNLEKLKNLESTKTIAEGDYLKFVNQQVNVRPELTKYFNNSIQPAQLKGKKKQIPKDMALLSYLPGENQLYIFVATSDTVIAKVVNVTRTELIRNINASLNIIKSNQGEFDKIDLANEGSERRESVLSVSQTDPFLKPFEVLYHSLIAPAIDEIAGKKRLCIIPSGALSYIPFQLLGKTMKNGKFSLLINQYSIFYANSTDMLLRNMSAEVREFNILAFGNPDKSLPSTEKEVNELKKIFPNTSVFIRDEATEDKAKYAGENYNIMHFATHGNLDYEDFGKSFLTMASNPAKHEDGLLTLDELWGMDVMSHLKIVVLSACQTAVSKGSDESSPVSPASGFLQNGVKSVVATLWKVDDEATSLLITDFYRNIKTMDAVDALRMAQVHLSNNPKYSHPYYWAGAVLLGDWR